MALSQGSSNCTAVLARFDPSASDSAAAVGIGLGFMAGMLVSFLPQICGIARRRSAEGISLSFALCSALMGAPRIGAPTARPWRLRSVTCRSRSRKPCVLVPAAPMWY